MPKLLFNAIGIALLLFPAGVANPQARRHSAVDQLPDLAWTRDYAVPYTTSKEAAVRAKVQQQLNLEPRLLAALHVALPQQQWFWKDRGRYGSVAEVAQQFLGVPGRSWDLGASAWLDDDRYVTEEGCVPHYCPNRGMLWIDTRASLPDFVFLATDDVSFGDTHEVHLWVFVSSGKIGNALPVALQGSARRWRDSNQAEGYKQKFLLATIVTPDGGMRDLTPEDFFGKTPEAGAAQ